MKECRSRCKPKSCNNFAALKNIFSSPEFLAVCILLTVSAVFDIRQIITVLMAAASWVIYSDAKSAETLKTGGLKFLAAVFRIKYIIAWIFTGLIGFVGAAASVMLLFCSGQLFSLLGSAVDYSADISGALSDMLARLAELIALPKSSVAAALLTFIIFILAAAGAALLNMCFTAHYMKYFEDMWHIANGDENSAADHGNIAVRMLIGGIITLIPGCIDILSCCLPAVSPLGMGSGIPSLCLGAAYITGYMIIKKNSFYGETF